MYKIPANLGFKSNLVHYLPSCHSTNEITANLLAQDLEEGAIIITDNQEAGRGQRGNYWESAPFMNLTFSLVLKPAFLPLKNQFQLTQIISLSLTQMLQSLIPNVVKIKWPNDIYVGNAKIGGILIQNTLRGSEIEYSIVGIGLNINQVHFETPNATSLRKLTLRDFNLNEVLNDIVRFISENYFMLKNENKNDFDGEYKELLYGLNEVLKFESDEKFAGKIIGTDPLGRLLIESAKGVKCFQNQEVKFCNI